MYQDESLQDPLTKKRIHLVFIDKTNYTALMDKSFELNDIAELIEKPNDKVSMLTRSYIVHTNEHLNKVLFDTTGRYYNFDTIGVSRNSLDLNYIKDTFKEKMGFKGGSEKYYELKLLANCDILVIISDGFLNNIIESKDNLLKFILDCLSYTYKLNYSLYSLLKLYINVKLNSNYLDMLKLRS